MALDFRFPDVGEGIHEGVIVAWLVKEGDAVAVDQPFVKVETDKAVVDLPAPKAGKVLALHFAKGATIHVGDVIATFGDGTEKAAPAPAVPAPPRLAAAPAPSPTPTVAPAGPKGKVLATPHTRAYARKLGVDLASVAPTGKNGRVTDEDVDRAAAGPKTAVAPAPLAAAPLQARPLELTDAGPVERVTGFDTVFPFAMMEGHYLPSRERVAAAARRTLEF